MPLTAPPSAPPAAPTAPGDPPSRANPSTFRTLADSFVVWQATELQPKLAGLRSWVSTFRDFLATHVTELDALQADVTSKQSTASTASTAAVNAAAAAAHIYPGAYAMEPTTRPDGSPMQDGDRYVGTDGLEYILVGGEWSSAANSAQAASEAALDAETVLRTYSGLAAGEAATTTGQTFFVRQAFGKGGYEYQRTATGSTLVGVRPIGGRARQIAYERVIKNTLAPPVTGLTTHLWGPNAWEWDQRLVPNEVSAVLPTLNWLPDPFNPLDEDGGTTPARTINTAATTDPLGGSNALQLDVTAANQQLAFNASTSGAIPATDVRVRIYTKLLSGGSGYKLGTTSGLSITPGASWDASALETTIAGYTGSTAIGISSATGNTASSVAVAGAGVFDPLAGESASLPTLAQSLAAQNAGHAKASLAFPGALPLTTEGAISLDGANRRTPMIYLDANHTVQTKYSFGGAFKCAALPTGGYGSALAFDKSFNTPGSDNTQGQIGVYGATDPNAGRPGRLYVNPGLSVSLNTTNRYYPGEGWHTVFVTVDAGDTTIYLDGVPEKLGVVTWAAPAVARMIMGAYNGTRPRAKTANPYVGEADGIFYAAGKVLSQAEVSQQDKHIRARLRLYGRAIGKRGMLNIGGGDSLCAFAPSWWWHLGECTQLSPRLHGHLEAQGGTRLRSTPAQPGDWTDATRYGNLVARIQAGIAAGYDQVWFFILPGANDSIASWIDNGYDYHPWKTEFLAYIAGIKALGSNVRVAVLTMLPRGGAPDEIRLEQVRQAWNDDLRANWAAMGFDRLIDTGLGTERVDISGVVSAETIPGGTLMGNYRVSQAAKTHTRNPAATLTLSATSGASFTGTAPAGTFSSADVYRAITTAAGYAVITNFSTAGGTDTVTLSTTNYVPPAWPNEPAAITTRDTITRTAFEASSFASGAWTVQADSNGTTRLYQNDGIHPGYPGGRMLSEIVWPHAKAIQDALAGAAL